MTTNEDEEEETRAPARPNAYWARVREGERGGFSSEFRGVNQGPHGGAQRVRPEDIIGDYDTCWCGQPADHDWPGKDKGRKHPKEQSVSASSTEQPDTQVPHITRNDLNGFSDSYKEVILKAVNDYRVRYRMSNKGILMYPHDGTAAYSLPMRENPRTLKAVRTWFVKHVADPETEARMEKLRQTQSIEEAAQVLAETLNDPVEHPVPEGKEGRVTLAAGGVGTAAIAATTGVCPNCGMETRTANGVTKHRLTNKVECVDVNDPSAVAQVSTVPARTAKRTHSKTEERRFPVSHTYDLLMEKGLIRPLTEGWKVWQGASSENPNPLYETDGTTIACRAQDCTFTTTSGKGASGHMVRHDPDRGAALWGAAAQVKKQETKSQHKVINQITEAIAILNKVAGIEPVKEPTKAESDALAKAIKERDAARDNNDKLAAARDDWKAKYEDLKAKLDLLKDL